MLTVLRELCVIGSFLHVNTCQRSLIVELIVEVHTPPLLASPVNPHTPHPKHPLAILKGNGKKQVTG